MAGRRLALTLLVLTGGLANPVTGQYEVSGRVVDGRHRPLPFVVVTSRTRNGFLSIYTDLDGRFDLGGRPHRRGDAIEFSSAGYERQIVRLDGPATGLQVTLDSATSREPTRWGIGLAADLQVQLSSRDGAPINSPITLRQGESYQLRVVVRNRVGCLRLGPSRSRVDSTTATVAFAVFVRTHDCGVETAEYDQGLELRFDRVGAGSIHVVGRYRDVVIPIAVQVRP